MSQAKTLTPTEIQQVLNFIEPRSYAMRNRVMFLTGLWSGMRVGEIASLSVGDVRNTDGSVRSEIRLTAAQTKGRHPAEYWTTTSSRISVPRWATVMAAPPSVNSLRLARCTHASSSMQTSCPVHGLRSIKSRRSLPMTLMPTSNTASDWTSSRASACQSSHEKPWKLRTSPSLCPMTTRLAVMCLPR